MHTNLGVKTAFLAYNTAMQSSTGQTLFFARFVQEETLPVNWIYSIPKADSEMEISDWTEVIQERFQLVMLVCEKNDKPQYVQILNTTSQSCQSLKLGSGSGFLI